MTEVNKTQAEKFKEAAREADCDPDESRWNERLKRVVKSAPKRDG